MRKLFISVLALSFLIISAGAYAQRGISGRDYKSNCSYIAVYNASGAAMTSGTVVVLASTSSRGANYSTTQVTSATTLGAYVTTTTTADDALVIGVIDDDSIASTGIGRAIVAGPARVRISTDTGIGPGTLIGTATTAGQADVATGTYGTTVGVLGVALDNVEAADADNNGQGVWIWVFPR